MELFSLEVGGIRTNCYLLKNTATGEGIIVDPGAEPERIMEKLAETGMKPAAILLTHGHFDHIGGVPELHERFGIPYELGEADRELIRDPGQNMSYAYRGAFSVEPDALVREGDELLLAGFRIRVIETPGHTAGSVSYYLPEEGLLFSGDTLFFETFGATHYPTGDRKKLTHSVRHKLLPLTETVRVLPGHGPETTIAHERQYNPLRSPVFS